MKITSFGFLLYFLPVMLAGYYLLGPIKKARNIWLILCGLGFYFLNGIEYAVLVAALAVMNHVFGYAINKFQEKAIASNTVLAAKDAVRKAKRAARNVMQISVIANLIPLLVLGSLPRIIGNFTPLFNVEQPASFMAPFGLAFFALQGISYTVDIFRGKVKWNPNIVPTLVYFTYFPTAFAGPVIKYHEVEGQLENREINFDKISEGICRLVVGLAKLCIIAEPLLAVSRLVTDRSNMSGIYSSAPISLMLAGLASCIIGMYHLFSGFSDVAIGLGKMLGFTLPENFKHPHMATTVSTYWQRCYSTLTGWFDEYVYDSLSKNRKNNDMMVLHMLIVWLLIGGWAGASLPSLIFGFWNFVFLLFEKVVEMKEKKTKTLLRHLYVMIVAVVSVIALNTSGLYQFTLYISNLTGMKNYGFYSDFAIRLLIEYWPVLLAGLIATFPIGTKFRQLAFKSAGSVDSKSSSSKSNALYKARHSHKSKHPQPAKEKKACRAARYKACHSHKSKDPQPQPVKEKSGFFGVVYTVIYPLVMVVLVALIVLRLSGVSYDPTQLFTTYLWS